MINQVKMEMNQKTKHKQTEHAQMGDCEMGRILTLGKRVHFNPSVLCSLRVENHGPTEVLQALQTRPSLQAETL